MVYDIFNFLTGYVYIKIEGVRLEQLLNSNISFWNVSRKGYCCIYANVSFVAYNKLMKNSEYSITLIKERGLLCIIKRMWKNKVLFFGMALCVIALIVMSQMVIGIEVNGYYSLNKQQVEEYVKEMGVNPFSFKRSVDLDALTSHLTSKDDIAWASAGYKGVVLNVVIIEQVNENDNTPSDILSDRQAVIKKIDVYSGIKNKQIGDVVQKGDVLVTGMKMIDDNIVERIKSRANIIGTFWEYGSYTIEAQNLAIRSTGNSVKQTYIDFWGNKAYINNPQNNFEHYVSVRDEKVLGGARGILPVRYVSMTYNEVDISYEAQDINELKDKASKLAFENAVQNVPTNAKIVNVDTNYEMNQGYLIANCIVEVEMDIGVNAPVQ